MTHLLPPLQPASDDIWDSKYRLKDRHGHALDAGVDDTLIRVATVLAEQEQPERRDYWRDRFLWALRQGAVPAGRVMSNAGAQAHKPETSLINCTVSGTIRDSMHDILSKALEAGMTLKNGSGIGYEFSTLRPRGAYVAGAGSQTSGPLSFMDIYDKVCFTVASAGGRRGAQMGTFDISHPDVREFIRAKREDGRLRQFNLSLLITHEFLQAVRADGPWSLTFPLHAHERDDVDLTDTAQVVWKEWPVHEGYIVRADGLVAHRVYQTIRARHLWNMVMAATYDYAEPGFILIDRVNEMNNNWWCENIRATNPCVTADTWVQTAAGPRQGSDLLGHGFMARVDGRDHATGAEGFFRTATKPVLALQTEEGYRLRLTEDHRLRRVSRLTSWSMDTEWCAAGALRPGDRVLLNDHRANAQWPGALTAEQGYLLGMLVGGGTLQHETAVLSVWPQAAVVNGPAHGGARALMAEALRCARTLPHRADFAGWSEVAGRGEFRMQLAALRDLAFEFGMGVGDKAITPALEQASSEACRAFLRGFFDADGSVQGSQAKGVSVRLAQSDLPRLEAVQRMLLRLGMPSRIHRDRRAAGERHLPDGHGGTRAYATQAQHELVIAGESLQRFAELIGFADTDKAIRLKAALSGYKRTLNRACFVATVASLQADGVEDVYDVRVPGINTFDGNGLHAHNCGEQPLPPYGSCLLGSINLTRFVNHPFTDNATFDIERFEEVVEVFTRMLDNVVEINGLPLEGQRQEILSKRRHGMGYFGLGSAMVMMGLRYGSPASLAFTESVTRSLALVGWRAALSLALEKGPAPLLQDTVPVTAAMLRLRPEMADDGFAVGDPIRTSVLHARYSRYMQRIAALDPDLVRRLEETGARFTHHSSIAPTGTIALSFGNNASNGIEPSFAHAYARNVIRPGRKTKEKVDVVSYELLLYRALVRADAAPGTGGGLPETFITSDDITPRQHVDVQAAAQRWIDSSISKTANIPTDYPFADFQDIYLYADACGLKGCTTFRFNPAAFQGVLVKEADLENTTYQFTLEDGHTVEFKGNALVEYDGETHTAANLFDALKEGYYGKL